jgi:YidC/Oxa1 family membrane protein insertase
MHQGLFTTTLVQPLYNGLVFLLHFIPQADAGVAIIIFTVIVKLILYPFTKKSIQTQVKMKQYEPELETIKERFKNNKQLQAEKTMAFYKEKGLNPLSGFLLILVQIPIIYALYYVFLRSGLPSVNQAMLYSFVPDPGKISMNFLGAIDISTKSYFLALLCAVSQFFQIRLSVPNIKAKTGAPNFKDDLARSMNLQMKYFFPVMVFFISYSLSGIVALYWITSNLFSIGQEVYVRRRLVGK